MINLGDKKWGVKDSGLLAYKQVGSKFFNKDFDFTRASSATRVNKQGLIETVASGVPRIDFTDANGALLLEPQRTNLLTYSEDFSNPAWNKINSTINSNQTISPKGDLTADLLSATTTTGSYFIDALFVTPAQKYTYSIFAKKSNSDYFAFIIVDGANVIRQYYNVSDGTVGITNNTGSPIVENIKIENYGNGWYRCSLTIQALNSAVEVRNYVIQNDGIATAPIGSEIFLWGIQSEQGSYATSYIPTYGSAQTRLGETCTNSGSAQDFNSEEGVLYAEIAALVEVDNARRFITLNDGTSSNGVVLRYEASGEIVARYQIGGVAQCSIDFATTITNSHKIAFKYSLNDFALWVDGVEVGVDNSGNVLAANTINNIDFNSGNGTFPFYGKARSVKYFPTALGDSKLITLTGGDGSLYGLFNSFKARVLADGGTIESQDCIINELKELL
jgi:hypothetical protein